MPGAGRPRNAGRGAFRPSAEGERRRFRAAEPGHPQNVFAAGFHGHLAELVEEALAEGGGVKSNPDG
jgi:hypothetical protein